MRYLMLVRVYPSAEPFDPAQDNVDEWIGGFDLLECHSIGEAVEIASKHPMARVGRIEVRKTYPG